MLAFLVYEKSDCLAASTGANDSSRKADAVHSVGNLAMELWVEHVQ